MKVVLMAVGVASVTRSMPAGIGVVVPVISCVQAYVAPAVDEGQGTFVLYLPMLCRGWPHVSFYPADGGGDFGGNYFGTGDSVLTRWWGSKDSD